MPSGGGKDLSLLVSGFDVRVSERQLLTQQELSKMGKGYLEAGEHLSLGFASQEYCGLPLPSPGDLTDPGIEPSLPHWRQTL